MSLKKDTLDIEVKGIVSVLPKRKIDNTFFNKFFEKKTVKDITSITGVNTRYWSDQKQTSKDLCLDAAKKLIEGLSIEPETIEAIIFITQTPDYVIPGNSFFIHKNLNLNSNCYCTDINSGCSGYVNGLATAKDLILARGYKRLLLLAGDTISKTLNIKNSSTSLIFGDAGTATLIEASNKNQNQTFFSFGSDGNGSDSLIMQNSLFRDLSDLGNKETSLYMNGSNVFNFTIQRIPKFIEELAAKKNQSIDKFDYILMHQANKFLINHIRKKLGLSSEKIPINIDSFGNTSCASIPLIICSNLKERFKKNFFNCALIGFGVGFSWAGIAINLGPIEFLDLHYS